MNKETKNVPKSALCFREVVTFETEEKSKEPHKRSFAGVAYSGEEIKNHWFWGDLIFDCDSVSSKDVIPALKNHDPSDIVGYSSMFVKDHQILVNGVVSAVTDGGKEVAGLADEGFPWQMSVFIEPSLIEDYAAGISFSVNGKEFVGPKKVFKNSLIKEVSFVALGADSNTSASVFEDNKETINIQTIEKKEIVPMLLEIKDDTVLFQGNQVAKVIKENEEFKFDCGCGGNKDKKTVSIEEFEALQNELNAYKEKEKKDKELAKKQAIVSMLKESKINPTDDVVNKYMEMTDDKIELVKETLKSLPKDKFAHLTAPVKTEPVKAHRTFSTAEEVNAEVKRMISSGEAKTIEEASKIISGR